MGWFIIAFTHFVKAAAAHSLNTPPIPKGQCQHSELSHTYSTHTPSQRRKIVSFNWGVPGGSFYSNWGLGVISCTISYISYTPRTFVPCVLEDSASGMVAVGVCAWQHFFGVKGVSCASSLCGHHRALSLSLFLSAPLPNAALFFLPPPLLLLQSTHTDSIYVCMSVNRGAPPPSHL